MSDKAECPGCTSYLSSILTAFKEGRDCPHCGLSATTALEIETIRGSRANEAAANTAAKALIQVDRMQKELVLARAKLRAIEDVVKRPTEQFGSPW